MTKITKENISQWYDNYSDRQIKSGINERHKKIMFWLKKFGLTKHSKILEVGCGIGTQTQLIAQFQKSKGLIYAIDISTKSIEIAKTRLKSYSERIKFFTGDITNFKIHEKFDTILLPDVIEHIPIEKHTLLFKNLRTLIKDNGNILVHIPNPYYLQWCHENTPDLLQIIDQPIYIDRLIKILNRANLYIDYLETYSIWIDNNDYQVINIKPNIPKHYKIIIKKNTLKKVVYHLYQKIKKNKSISLI